jgi:hypothetical protein
MVAVELWDSPSEAHHTLKKSISANESFEFIKYIGSFLDWNVLRIEIFSMNMSSVFGPIFS